MKKLFTLLTMTLFVTGAIAQTSFSDDFESYSDGDYVGVESDQWTTWSGTTGGAEDAAVVTDQSASGSNSIYFEGANNGGPQDVLLLFGDEYTDGLFTFSIKMLIESGDNGYFNFQAQTTPGEVWTCDINAADGNIALTEGSSAPLASGPYTPGEWFEIEIVANMTLNIWQMFIDGESAGSFTSGANQVATLDIFPIDGASNFWVDDVSYTWEEFTVPSLNASALSLEGVGALADIPYNPNAQIRNNGMENITSFDVEFTDGTNNFTENVTGVNLQPGDDYIVELNELTLGAGQQNLTVTVSNVNGNPSDDYPEDDVYNTNPNLAQPAFGKRAVVEEGTGTWCQYCPRGAYTMDRLDNLYGEYFVGIAVHNDDPMTVEEYDTGIALPGYPTGRVDRGTDIGDAEFEAEYLDRMTVAPSAYVTVGAQYNEETRFLEVIVAAEFLESVSGDYKMGLVIIEDSVTGTGPGYSQVNFFSGEDVDLGGYEDLPNPIPASQMVYNHVGRAILPSYEGGELNLPDNMVPGDNYGINFETTLPEEWDEDHIELVGILYEPNGTANNAYKASLETAIDNGWIDSDSLVTGITKIPAPDADIKLFPNPSEGMSFVTLDMDKSENVSVDVVSIDGKTMAGRAYGNLSGVNRLPINTANFAEGMYLIKIRVGNTQKVEKLMVK